MDMRSKAVVLCSALMICLWQLPVAEAGEPKPVAAGPIPTQIASAKKVFIANAGENQPVPFDDAALFSGGSERAYNEFYAGVRALGRYDLVGAPADADLLFEIELTSPRNPNEPELFGNVPYDAQFRLVIRDPKTNALLWAVNEHVQWAILQGNRDKNFEQAMDRVVNDVQGLAARAAVVSNNKP
jgi:hypothetical protein